MEKDLNVERLFEIYGGLLTDRQREITEMFYALDLSLGEIAEIKSTSRQAVADALKKSRKTLASFEEKLSLFKKRDETEKIIEKLSALGGEAAIAAVRLKEISEGK